MTPAERAVLDAAIACAQGEPGDIQLWDAMASAVDALERKCICGTPGMGDFEGPLRDCPVHGELEQPEVSYPPVTVRISTRGVDSVFRADLVKTITPNDGLKHQMQWGLGNSITVEVRT